MVDTCFYNFSLGENDCYFNHLKDDIEGHWAIIFDDLGSIGFDLDIENTTIILNNYGLRMETAMQSNLYRPQIQLAMVEALRMVRHVEWLDGTLENYNPEDIIHIGRICVADTSVYKIMIAWEMKMDGDASLWKHVLGGELSDMAATYANGLEKYESVGYDDISAIHNAVALAFNTWFSGSDRLQTCDHDALNLMDHMMNDGCEFGSKKIRKFVVNGLTKICGESISYIDTMLQDDIIHNGYYRDVNDPINHAHLSQIVHDMNKTHIGGLVFQDADLAARFAFS